MAEKPFWQYFAIAEPESLIPSVEERLNAVIIMSLAFLIITLQTIYILGKIRSQKGNTGSKVQSYYYIMFIGLYMMAINSFLIRLSTYLTDGKFTVLSQEKAILFFGGTLVFVYGLTYVSFSIIDFRKSTYNLLKWVFRLFLVLGSSVVVLEALYIIGIDFFIGYMRPIQSFTALLAVFLMFVFMFGLFSEGRSNPSKIEKLRLTLLTISVFCIAVIFLTTGSTSIFKDPNDPSTFILVTTYLVPFTYLIVQSVMNVLLYWNLLTPNWLLVKSGVIQPSFRDFLKKRQNK